MGRDLVRADDPDAGGLDVAGLVVQWCFSLPRRSDYPADPSPMGSLAQEMASATVSLGGTGPAMIGPGTAGPLSSGGGEGWRPSDTLLRRVQDRPRTVFA